MTEAGRVEPGWGEEVCATGGVTVTAETQGYLFAGRSSTGLYFGFQDRQHYVVTETFILFRVSVRLQGFRIQLMLSVFAAYL